jgi:hypothetical protein
MRFVACGITFIKQRQKPGRKRQTHYSGVASAGNISVPEDAPAVLGQGQSSDASDARKYFQDLQQALAELPWIEHVLH